MALRRLLEFLMNSYDLKHIIAEELAHVSQELKSQPAPMRQRMFDKVLPGFGIVAYPTGRKVYLLQTRIAGRQRTLTIGNAAAISQAVAKDVARRVILRAELGMNPVEDKQRTRSTPDYNQFLSYYWEIVSPNWKPETLRTHNLYRSNHLEQAFAGKFIDEISSAETVRWHAEITRSSGPGAANRVVEILRAAFNRAEKWGFLAEHSNPFLAVKHNRKRKIERYLTDDEMNRLGKVLAEDRLEKPILPVIIMMLMLTGCRRSEITNLLWSEVKGSRLYLRDSKTGARIIWLGSQANALLRSFPRRTPTDFVFPFVSSNRPSAVSSYWCNIRRKANLDDVRLHDLRHNYASYAARQSETLPMIGKLLGHAKIGSTLRYAHLDDATLLVAAGRVGDVIEKQMERL